MMISPALIRAVESKDLIDILTIELTQNLGTSHYRRLHQDDLYSRVSGVYRHLAEWLQHKDETVLRSNGEDLGRKRFSEGVPLGQVILALILNEKHLWKLMDRSGHPVSDEDRGVVTEFFQKHTYYTGRGYEEALSGDAANHRPHPAGTNHELPRKVAAKSQPERDLDISRGGQVGELGG